MVYLSSRQLYFHLFLKTPVSSSWTGPVKPDHSAYGADGKYNQHYVGIFSHQIRNPAPGFSQNCAQTDQGRIPQNSSHGSIGQKASHWHPAHACRDGNQATHDGDKAAEKYGLHAFGEKPFVCFFHIFWFQAEILSMGPAARRIRRSRFRRYPAP